MSNESRWKLREIVVVEGRDDITAVKRAVDAEVYAVHGFGVRRPEVLSFVREAARRAGVIVLTDPDRAGELIRATIEKHVPTIKHAYIMRSDGTRPTDGNIGVENASPEVIRDALRRARQKAHVEAAEGSVDPEAAEATDATESAEAAENTAASDARSSPAGGVFSIQDLLAHGLVGCAEANERRQRLGQHLGVGYASAKQLLRRLHAFGITRDEFDAAVEALDTPQPSELS